MLLRVSRWAVGQSTRNELPGALSAFRMVNGCDTSPSVFLQLGVSPVVSSKPRTALLAALLLANADTTRTLLSCSDAVAVLELATFIVLGF